MNYLAKAPYFHFLPVIIPFKNFGKTDVFECSTQLLKVSLELNRKLENCHHLCFFSFSDVVCIKNIHILFMTILKIIFVGPKAKLEIL